MLDCMSKTKLQPDRCTLADVVKMINRAMPYIDGSATVTFQVRGSGKALNVSQFRLQNNHDAAAVPVIDLFDALKRSLEESPK